MYNIKYIIFVLFQDNMETSKNFVKLQKEELNVSKIMELVTFPNCGAISSFIGITRDNFENKKVKHYRSHFKRIAKGFFIFVILISLLQLFR